MIRYFKSLKKNQYADLLQGSKFAYQVARPDGVNADDVTREAFNIIKHPLTDDYIAVVDGDINVHTGVRALAQTPGNFPNQDAFNNNPADNIRMRGLLRDNVRVNVVDLMPKRWKEVSYNTLVADGWFEVQI